MAAKPAQQRTRLTLADRVAYQRAIEEVYWRHRIWPKERPDPKPSLDEVMPSAQLEKKVEDYLRNSQALEDYWHEPLSAEQLQAEMERMAQHTKQPEVLSELFEALGNDPFVIAECLARPALSERLVANLYAHDQRFHGELRHRAETELQAHRSVRQMKQTSGNYSEIELVRNDTAQDEENRGAEPGVKMNSREWDENVQKLGAMFGSAKNDRARTLGAPITQIRTEVLSPLQEDEGRYYATAVVKKTKDRMKVATVEWRKEPLELWRARAENQLPKVTAAATANYTLPAISDGANGCTDDTWAPTSVNTPTARDFHTAVWTGSEMIVWGGFDGFNSLNTGARYNPITDTWIATSTTNAPSARLGHTAVWTGSEMIVWGGSGRINYLNSGGRYNPGTDSWIAISTTNAPAGRLGHTAVWSGTEMIVWGGFIGSNDLNTGGRYNPSTDTWTATSTTNAPSGREDHTAVWTGSEMIVWGGSSGSHLNTGGRYNPGMNSWMATSTTNAPAGRSLHKAVWTGSEMIVWGGTDFISGYSNTGGRYNPGTNSWTATSTTNVPAGRFYHTAVWTGSEMIVWGGSNASGDLNTGGRYNPGTDSWIATSSTNAPTVRERHTAVWTGNEMIVWGGFIDVGYDLNTGGRYNPGTDSWTATSVASAPTARNRHTAVWTGSEMIVWGGYSNSVGGALNTGGRYNPSTDSWIATSTTNAPSPRDSHTAVWTGSEMIVWGGTSGDNTGGRYNPGMDGWTATSTTNAPSGRYYHSGVWTGSEMIVWGGFDGTNSLNTGGRYNPGTDGWTATSTTNVPTARKRHTAVWTGSEMIVWGGLDGTNTLNTGGRYDPGTDGWATTSTTNAPSGREAHTAVWTGSQMIVWGGDDASGVLNTGGRYNPGTDSWTTTSTTNAPAGRDSHTAVWTGGEMIVWGGFTGDFVPPNTGGRYNPGTDSWTNTSITNAPGGRVYHTAVWTGSQMIVWGGNVLTNFLNDGGRYCAQPPGQLGNISARAFVQTGDNVMIGGFIITGSGQKRVIVRAIGPSLVNHGVANPLRDPTLELHDHTGAVIAFNDNWMDAPNRQEIIDSGLAPSNNLESAILMSLNPGNYTAIVRGVNNGTGIGLVEGYDLDPTAGSKLGNISTRAFVQTGDNVMIGGFIITGSGQKRVIVRAIGPSLVQHGIPNPLQDPTLELHDHTGAVIAFNDNWMDAPNRQEIIDSGLAPSNNLESAILTRLTPGNYTAIVRGVNNTIGVALVEVYGLN
jgi:N-acetylneuraminic acid mutarotase